MRIRGDDRDALGGSVAKTSLFSTYRQGENRVTSSMLAVFERIDPSVVERILASATGESSLSFITFTNQLVGKPGSVPDASISANFQYLFEVKTTRNAVNREQLRRHLQNFDLQSSRDERLFVVTPDAEVPKPIGELGDSRVMWLNFVSITQAIDDLLSDPLELISEQTRFLLREMQALFAQDGLLDSQEDVVIVAARIAYDEYRRHHAYFCQPRRSFRSGLSRIAFYTDGAVQPEVPRILARRDNIGLTAETASALRSSPDMQDRKFGALIEQVLKAESHRKGNIEQIFLLSSPEDPDTLMLANPISNTKTSANGRKTAFTQGQRYTRSEVLKRNPPTTDDLEKLGG
jgi:hypothetical protein